MGRIYDNISFHFRRIKLTTILKLRDEIEKSCNFRLKVLLNGLTFVGSINAQKAIIQHETKMYLCDTQKLR